MKRKEFIKKSLLSITGIGVLSGIYAWQIEPFWLEFTKVKMPLKNLPKHLIGKTVMQISDIHVGNRFDYNHIISSFKKAKSYNPDFVVYTGDYVSTHNDLVQFDKLNEVFKHAVTGTFGTFGILGNHDYGVNWQEEKVALAICGVLEKNNIQMLRNEKVTSNGLDFIGIDDYWGLNFNPKIALQHFDKNKATITLCHNPDVCDLAVWGNYNSWILSGHTHGGQCKPPFLPAPILPVKNKKYSSGLIELSNNRNLYINRALGHLWQVRFNVRPEITIFTLELA